MSRFAKYFATIQDGKVAMITDATPAQELLDNQIMLTYKEWKLLCAISSLDEAKQLMGEIDRKIGELNGEG